MPAPKFKRRKKIARARELRRDQTPYELQLWQLLRRNQMDGFHFRRQHPIGPYIADFVCVEAKLIIELDGKHHQETQADDENRDFALNEAGWTTLRFSNVFLRDQPDELWQEIETWILTQTACNCGQSNSTPIAAKTA